MFLFRVTAEVDRGRRPLRAHVSWSTLTDEAK